MKTGDGEYTCINGEAWPESFELCWYLRFSPLGKLTALVRIDDEWTLAVDGVPWEERFEYVWNPIFSADGKAIAVACKRDNRTAWLSTTRSGKRVSRACVIFV